MNYEKNGTVIPMESDAPINSSSKNIDLGPRESKNYMFYSLQNNIAQLDTTLPGIEDCIVFMNAVFYKIDSEEAILVRCQERVGKEPKSSIKIIIGSKVHTLNIQDTKEYLEWKDNGNWLAAFIGAEEPRLFAFQNEIYIYYTMTNPHATYPIRSLNYIKLQDAIDGKNNGQFLTPQINGKKQEPMEKNWMFLHTNKYMLAVYSLKPYILAEVEGDKLVEKIRRDYGCLNRFENTHLSSNVLRVNNKGKEEFMFVFSQKINHPKHYLSHLAFMESSAPFRLLRFSQDKIEISANATKFVYIASLTVKNKEVLHADPTDTILVSGGLDDDKMFLQEFEMQYFLDLPTQKCLVENKELDFMIKYTESEMQVNNIPVSLVDTTSNPTIASVTLDGIQNYRNLISIIIICFVPFLIYLLRKRHQNRKKNKEWSLHTA